MKEVIRERSSMDIGGTVADREEWVESLSLSSKRVDWLEEIWSGNRLAPEIRSELVEVDRLVRGITAIADLMRADRQCRILRDDFQRFSYDALRPAMVDGLECGLQSLLSELDHRLERLRFP